MKKILIIHPALAPYRIDFFNALSSHFRIELVLLHENITDNPFDQESLRKQLHFPVEVSRTTRTFLHQPVPSGLHRKIIAFRPDIVICSEFSLLNNLMYLLRKVRHYRFALATITDDNTFRISAPGSFLRTMNRNLLCRLLDGIITLDIPEVKAFYQSKAGVGKTIGIHHLVRDSCLFIKQFENSILEENHLGTGGQKQKLTLLFVGRFVREKGLDILLAAFQKIALTQPDVQLRLVGEGVERAAIVGMIHQLGISDHVILDGRLEGAALLNTYRLADLFILPSRFEPFGAVVNEALLAGLPVICSDMVGAKCLVAEGVSGSVFNSENPDSLLDKLIFWIGKLRTEQPVTLKKNLTDKDAGKEVVKLAGFLNGLLPGRMECV